MRISEEQKLAFFIGLLIIIFFSVHIVVLGGGLKTTLLYALYVT